MQPKITIWLALLCYAFIGSAQTNWTGNTSTDWFDASNWDNGVPTAVNQPATIPNIIPGSFTPIINAGAPPYTIDFDVNVNNSLQVITETNIAGQINIGGSGTFAVAGQFIDVNPGGSIINNGGLSFNAPAESFNSGLVTNNGGWTVNSGANLRNQGNGTMVNNSFFQVFGTLNNYGLFENNGTIQVLSGGIMINRDFSIYQNNIGSGLEVYGDFQIRGAASNDGNISNQGLLQILSNGNLTNNSTFQNISGSNLAVLGDGSFFNYGNTAMDGQLNIGINANIVNNNILNIFSNGIVDNLGLVQNFASFSLAGLLTNTGAIFTNGTWTNDFGSIFDNTGGLFSNGSCDYVYHYTSNPLNSGAIENFGIIYAIGSAVTPTGGNGAVFTSLNDNPAPNTKCSPAFSINLDAMNNASITVPDIDDGSDAPYCGIETYALSQSNFTCADIGPNNIILTVTDSLGYSSQCQTTVTVVDPFPPQITCPPNITQGNDPGVCGATILYNPPVGTDNCPNATTSITSGIGSGGFFPVGITTETYTVTDAYGNTASCSFTVTINDIEDPVSNCPPDLNVDALPYECTAIVNYTVTASDNCTVLPFITQTDTSGYTSGSEIPVGTTVIQSYEVVDGAGNTDECSFSITVHDFPTSSNTLACNDNAQVSLDASCTSEILPEMVLIGEYGCSDSFEVVIMGLDTNVVDQTHLGHTLTVRVIDNKTGNSCWGEIYIMDKFPPLLDSCFNDTLLCVENTDPSLFDGDAWSPVVMECSAYDVTYFDDIEIFDCSVSQFNQRIRRTWIAQDTFGQSSTCMQNIYVTGIPFGDIDPVCPELYEAECGSPEAADLSPSVTGYPTAIFMGDTLDITDTLGDFCGIKSTYSDDTLHLCGNSFKIIRTWKVIDCCAPTNPGIWTCVQIIKVTDTTAPVVAVPTIPTGTTSGSGCSSSNIEFPPAQISDCSPTTVRIFTPGGVIEGNGGFAPNPIPLGSHVITYVVTDECGNTTNESANAEVIDTRPPAMVCESFTTVSITTDGTAQVSATSLDDGTTDDCCLDYFVARRMTDACNMPQDTSFAPALDFCCADVGDTLQVVLRAYDCSGNFNECMVWVRVDNKLLPTLTCPPTVALDCEDDYTDLNLTGNVVTDPMLQGPNDGLVQSNCPNLTISYSDSLDLNCGQGTVYRTWTVTDADGDETTCVQLITLTNTMPFNGNDIVWPADTTLFGCDVSADTSVTGSPFFTADDCDNVLVYAEDDTLYSFGGACIYIQRNWLIVDWCQYVPGTTGPGRWEWVQIIRIVDTDGPVITGCRDKVYCNEDDNCQPLQVDLSVNISDACTDSALLNVFWVVDAFNDGIPDIGAQYNGSGMNSSNSYPIGTHKITYLVEDDCNNTTECSFLFKILDCKSPTAICKNGLSVSLMANGEVTLNADYFDGGVTDNCSPYEDLDFAFTPDPADSLRNFNCDDLGVVSVEMWVFDAIGNASSCQTFIDVQDNMGACTQNKGTVSGSIKDPSGSSVSNVTVQINGSGSAQQTTGNNGTFSFDNLDTGEDYTVAPFRNDDPRNGVSTIDIVLITKHILNVRSLDDPYKIIAADVNHSNSVTTLDLVAMRKLILHVSNAFPNNTSWRFVEKTYAFPDRNNPFSAAFPEVFNINDLSNTQVSADFMAIKVGDVTGDAFPNNSMSVGNRAFEETTYLHTYNKEVRKGDLVSISFYSDKNESLMGCQFTLDFDARALTMTDLKTSNWLSLDNFGLVRVSEGLVTFSWNQQNGVDDLASKAWFTLQFEAKENGKLSDWVHLGSRLTRAEAYDPDGNSMNLALIFNDGTSGTESYSLYQNKPNPFSEGTIIGFNLPEDATVNLTIFDLNGKMLKSLSGQFEKGYGAFNISSDDLSTGVMYYRLDAPGFTDTKKMILVDSRP